jgi:uncharacterized protein with GYD domain
VDYTDQGRRTIKDSPDRAEASKAEAAKLGINVKDLFYTPGGPHDAAIIIEAEGPESINKFMASVQSLGNLKMNLSGLSRSRRCAKCSEDRRDGKFKV